MPQIKIEPLNVVLTVPEGTMLKDCLRNLRVDFPCGGRGLCGKCLVKILQGDISLTESHAQWLNEKSLSAEWRLACLSKVEGDLVVEIPGYDMKILKPADNGGNFVPEEGWGIAIDLGSTTIVAQLVDLKTNDVAFTIAVPNPQISYGADILSRICYATKSKENADELQDCIVGCIEGIVGKLISKGKIVKMKKILIAGNTVMHHLFGGYDVAPLGKAPYETSHNESYTFHSQALGWHLPIPCEIEFLPNISHYVGSDILCGILSTGLSDGESYSILADLGTNGEIVIGNKREIICTSTAAGPAFEGVNISCGMRAETGAIYAVDDMPNEAIGCRTIDNRPARGICGSGLIEVVHWLLKHEYIDVAGTPLIKESEWPALAQGIRILGKDIREFQLAKAALSAGIEILLKANDIDYGQIERVHLTGGLGYYINISKSREMGLLSKFSESQIKRMANASLTGCRALLYESNRRYIGEILKKTRFCALESKKEFQDIFCEQLFLMN